MNGDPLGALSPDEIAMLPREPAKSARLGWIDLMFRANGESFLIEMEVTGGWEKKWMDAPRDLIIDGVYLEAAARVNILPSLTWAQINAIAEEVKPQARLRDDRPDLFLEAQ